MSKAAVYKATADDQKPVSGFVLKELADFTKASIQECTDILSLLLKRLEKDSPDVKFKYLCENGRAEFRIELQRQNEAVKQSLHYKGPLDPLRGDAPYQRVRDAAKEVMNATFSASSHSHTAERVVGRITGFGGGEDALPEREMAVPVHPAEREASSPHSYSPGTYGGAVPRIESGAYSTGRMVGFGNPAFPADKPSFLDKVRDTVLGKDQVPYRPADRPEPYAGATPEIAPKYGDSAARVKGRPGGSWGADAMTGSPAVSGSALLTPGGSFGNAAEAGAAEPKEHRKRVQTSGEVETRLVNEITAPSGVRSTLSAGEVKSFVDKCAALDHGCIASLLDRKLAPGSAVASQMKALCVLEAMIKSDSEDTEEYFCEHVDNLDALEKGGNAQLAAKALDILRALGLRDEAKPSVAALAAASSPPLGSAPQTVQSSGGFDLIGAYTEKAAAPAPAVAPAATSSFDFLGGDAAAAAPAARVSVSQTTSMFGDLQIKAPAQQQQATVSPTQQQHHAGDHMDVFSSIMSEPTPAAAHTQAPVSLSSASPPPATQSAFSFVASSPSSPVSPVPAGVHQPARLASHEDPLAHLIADPARPGAPAPKRADPLSSLLHSTPLAPASSASQPVFAVPYGQQRPPVPVAAVPGYGVGMQASPYGLPAASPYGVAVGGAGVASPYGAPAAGLPFGFAPAQPQQPAFIDFRVKAASPQRPDASSLSGLVSPQSAAASSSFGFIAADSKKQDSFAFVGDMMKS